MASLKLQILQKMDTLELFGASKEVNLLIESNKLFGIHNYNTHKTYKKHALDYATWERNEHPEKEFKDLGTMPRQHVSEWLGKSIESGESIYITKLKAVSMAKIMGCNTKMFGVNLYFKNGLTPILTKNNFYKEYTISRDMNTQNVYFNLTNRKRKTNKIEKYNLTTCPYCGAPIAYVNKSIIYGKKTEEMAYMCSNFPECDAYVGVHKGTNIPLGRLSNGELRAFKMQAHQYFDLLWKCKEKRGYPAARSTGYKWLSKQLNISPQHTHIGWLRDDDCKNVIETCKPYYWNLKNKLRTIHN